MILKLNENKPEDKIQFNLGDILIFYDGHTYDYYLVVKDSISHKFNLLSLKESKYYEKYSSIVDLIDEANNINRNGFILASVLKHNDVILKRVSDE